MKYQVFIFVTISLFSIQSWAMDDDYQTIAHGKIISVEDIAMSDDELNDSASCEDSDQESTTFFLHIGSPDFANFYFCMAGAYNGSLDDWVCIRKAWRQMQKSEDHSRVNFFNASRLTHKWCAVITKAIKQLDATQEILVINKSTAYGLVIELTTPRQQSRQELFDMCQECDPLNGVFTDEKELHTYLRNHRTFIDDIRNYARSLRKTVNSREFQERFMEPLDF